MITTTTSKKYIPFRYNALFAALAIFLGALIYIYLRPTIPAFFKWIYWLGLGGELETARLNTLKYSASFPNWFLYSFPDGLWAFAYALLMFGFWLGKTSKLAIFWMATVPLLIFGFEISQLTSTIPGTFCRADMAFQALGILLAFFSITNYRTKYYEENFT